MALAKEDFTTISKFVRDTVQRMPPRAIKAVGIGKIIGAPEADTPPASDSSDRIATTAFVTARVPLISSSPMSDGPPVSPNDGDIWIATSVDSNGTAWQFRYNAGSSSAYQWEFIGGAPLISQDYSRTARQVSSNSAWDVLPGISAITTARAGDYIFHVSGWMKGAVGVDTYYGVGATGGNDPNIHYVSENASNIITQATHGVTPSVAANTTWNARMFTSDHTTAAVYDPAFSLLPVRIS
jgi:hypothetical protein